MTNIAILASYNGSGLDTLHQASLDNILDLNIKLVISNNTASPALVKAKSYKIKNQLVNSKTDTDPDEKIYDLLKENDCEYVFLAGYMKKITSKITQNFKVINSHPSLLPKYGGAGMYGRHVHDAVVKNKESVSGVTVHEVNENYDDGKIIYQQEISLASDETAQTLETKIKKIEKDVIIEAFVRCLK